MAALIRVAQLLICVCDLCTRICITRSLTWAEVNCPVSGDQGLGMSVPVGLILFYYIGTDSVHAVRVVDTFTEGQCYSEP